MGERVESMNAKPVMFQAGISNKFTKRHVANFHDTTLTAASMAKQRAEKKVEKQADAIEKQHKKIETEMKKIEEITQKLHRQQVREVKRLRNRLHFAATRIQRAFRRNQARWNATQADAATKIQCRWRAAIARMFAEHVTRERHQAILDAAACVITRSVRVYACRMARERELLERYYAATMIQGIVRMAMARNLYRDLQRKRDEEHRVHQAATLIQCNVRSYMTRLIYLDVLYVICRIQAVVRGFLIRRRLQWVAAIDVDGICKFQALARGYMVRQRLREMWRLHTERSLSPGIEEEDGSPLSDDASSRQQPFNFAENDAQGDLELTAIPSQNVTVKSSESKLAARLRPQVEIVKRSYWLPAGASFSKRLPVLPSKRVAIVGRDGDDMSGDVLGFDVSSRASQARIPKKRNQKNRPARLAPVSSSCGSTSARLASDAETELRLENHTAEEKLKREEELKQKLLSRKTQEKKKLEQEQKLKREQENEANERKLMEREEKYARLLLKVLHRRFKEVKIKKQTAEQQGEERERIAMAREERQMRLLAKLTARQVHMKKHQALTAIAASTGTNSSTAATSATALPARMKGNKSRSELPANGSKFDKDPQDDDDMSFLNIDFKIPESMHARKSGRKTKKISKTNEKVKSTQRRDNGGNQAEAHDRDSTLGNAAHRLPASINLKTEMVDNENEFDYGDEFEDVIDEAKLGRLIC